MNEHAHSKKMTNFVVSIYDNRDRQVGHACSYIVPGVVVWPFLQQCGWLGVIF